MNSLEQLKRHTVVVADTGQFQQIAQFTPRDATTNPSLILKAAQQAEYQPLVAAAARDAPSLEEAADRVLVRFGCEILRLVPGRVSTEVDARLSFDSAASLARGRRLVALYEAQGIDRSRVLIKLAATWEGMQAARALQAEGIACNLTLVFAWAQAQACAHAQVQLISPFVGRIYDWHKKTAGALWDEAAHAGPNDPGVISVARIHADYKRRGIKTEVMGASFRNVGQVLALAGCDLLTIAPELLAELQASNSPVTARLPLNHMGEEAAVPDTEAAFRFALNEDTMASEKLGEGIRQFARDSRAFDRLLTPLLVA